MDHITKLYQNRAKVLQEEVNRLEGLLEAVVDAPPIKMSQRTRNEAASNAKAAADAQAAAKAAADAEIKKTEEAKKDIEERPILGRISKAHDDLVSGYYRGVANIKNNPYFDIAKTLGLGMGVWGVASPRLSVNPENAGKWYSIFKNQGVDQLSGEPVQGIFKKTPEILGRGFLTRELPYLGTEARNEKRLEKVVY
jgi:ribosomal protein L12E/L44/L45/RPP1/RPP2